MRHYDLVIFDFDGTLADSLTLFLSTFNRIATDMGFRPFEVECLEALREMRSQDLMARTGIRWWHLPEVSRRMHAALHARLDEVTVFQGMPEVIAQLAANQVQLAIVSSNAEANVRAVLGPQLCAHIGYFSCGASFFGKRRRLKAVLSHCKVSASRALYVGDETRDSEAAGGAGMAFAGVAWGYASPTILRHFDRGELLARPDALLQRVGSEAFVTPSAASAHGGTQRSAPIIFHPACEAPEPTGVQRVLAPPAPPLT